MKKVALFCEGPIKVVSDFEVQPEVFPLKYVTWEEGRNVASFGFVLAIRSLFPSDHIVALEFAAWSPGSEGEEVSYMEDYPEDFGLPAPPSEGLSWEMPAPDLGWYPGANQINLREELLLFIVKMEEKGPSEAGRIWITGE